MGKKDDRREGLTRRQFLAATLGATAALAFMPTRALSSTSGYSAEVATATGTVTLTEGTNIAVAVSPSHNNLVMDLQGVLWTLPQAGGPAKRITGNFDDPALPDWSPDGRRIVFQSYKDGNYHVWSMRPDGTDMQQLTVGGYDDREPRYSPDGSCIAFSSDRGGSYDIWVLNLVAGILTRWTDSPDEEYQPTWSPDGQEIAFVSADNDSQRIESVDASGNRRTLVTDIPVTEEDEGGIFSPSWSPDGEKIAYVFQEGIQSDLMVSGEQITQEEDVFPFSARWLSANKVLYTADGQIKTRELSQESPETIPFHAQLTVGQPSSYRHKEQDFNSRRPQPVKGIVSPTLSPNGEQIAFVALSDLWLLQLGEKTPRRLTDDTYWAATPAWAPDGKRLAYSSDKAGTQDIYILNVETGEERQLTSFPGAAVAAAWSQDGTQIAFQDQEIDTNGNTYTVDVESGDVRHVLEPLWEPGYPTWGPNGQTLALAAVNSYSERFREGTSQILNLNPETGSRHFVAPIPFKSLSNRVNSGPVWSPDGQKMAFVIESTLWIMLVDANGNPIGEPYQITAEVAESPSWSGDSATLLYLSNGNLRLISLYGGGPKTVPLKMAWKPEQAEGRTVIHVGRLWDGSKSEVRENVDIIVQGNRIKSIKPHDGKSHRGQYVDASDLTVIPGLWDAHTHQELSSIFLGSRQARQLFSFGVTSTISMGDPAYLAIEDRESLSSGARVGPRFFATGEPFDGSRVYYNFMRPTTSVGQLQNLELERARTLGYDLLKSYVRLPYTLQARVINEAHKMGVPEFSHYLYPPVGFGQDGMSHITATQRLGFSRTQSSSGYAYDDVIELAVRSGHSFTSTLFPSSTLLAFDRGLLSDPRVKTLYTSWQYESLQQKYEEAANTDQTEVRTELARSVTVLKEVLRSGGTVLGGTDIPLVDIAISLHLNLRAMVRYGMTPEEALSTVTSRPAEKMGVAEDLGTIEPGKLADLTFVEGNPLDNINDAANVHMVMKNGQIHTVDEIIAPYGGIPHMPDTGGISPERLSQIRND